jgi:hypothetical protein
MIPQTLEIIRRLDDDENWNVDVASYSIGSSTVYDIKQQKD